MARCNGVLCSSVCGIMMIMMIMGAAAQAPAPSPDCEQVVLTLSDCLGFVTGTDKTPPAACCTELSTVVKATPLCLCLLFNATFTQPLGVNITIAQRLPTACKVKTPSASLCVQTGVPVPAPLSSPVISPAKSPASPTPAKSPASTMAPAPASSPLSPSPSSSSSPTPSVESTPSPLSTTPAGSTTPPSSTAASTSPSPNSAQTFTLQNAAAVAAASLLFSASIFLS